MNLAEANVVIRQRTTFEVCDLSFPFVCALNPRLYLRLAAVLLFPCWFGCVLARHVAGWSWVAVWGLALSLGTIAQGGFTVAAGRLLFDASNRTRTTLATFAGRLPAYLGALALSRLLILLGSVFLVVGLYVWSRVAYVHEAVLLEEASAVQGTRRSAQFAGMKQADSTPLLTLMTLVTAAFIVSLEALAAGVVEQLLMIPWPFDHLLDDGGSAYALLGYFASIPFTATTRFLGYINARTRVDGWDVQVRLLNALGSVP